MSRRYVALLRAINVGGRTVRMDALKRLFEAQGFANVSTFIASGNVLFDSDVRDADALESRIGAFLQASLGYEVGAFVRTPRQMAAVAAYEPSPAAALNNGRASLYVIFLSSRLAPKAKTALLGLATSRDAFDVHGKEVFWLVRGKLLDSQVKGSEMNRAIGMSTTVRNITTVRKLATLLSP
jgi:uncharacterized protein (DUF1697 family)